MQVVLQQQTFGLIEPNTFIGGVGATYPTASSFLSRISTTISVNDLKNYQVVNGNISFGINKDYILVNAAFDGVSGLTYYIDKGLRLKNAGITAFRSAGLLAFKADGFTVFRGSQLREYKGTTFINYNMLAVNLSYTIAGSSSFKWGYFPNNITVSVAVFSGSTALLRINLRSATDWYNEVNENTPFNNLKTGCKIYVKPSEMTAYSGGLPYALSYAQNDRGAILIPATNTTPPSVITNLSVGTITSTTAVLNFTPPSSTNTLDFYEVWIERQDLDEWHKDRVKERYNIHQEITASGGTVTGLLSDTTYKIKIIACDEFWNRSEFSNEITVTTL